MDKLSLFKSGDLFNIIRDALLDFNTNTDSANVHKSYEIDCEDVYEKDDHYIEVIVYEASIHNPPQPDDVHKNINNRFRIKIECI